MSDAENGHAANAVNRVKATLDSVVRVTVSDGRLVEGQLQCLDSDMNIVLANATEYHDVQDVTLTPIPKDYISRYLGMAIIPGQHVVKVYAEGGVEDCV